MNRGLVQALSADLEKKDSELKELKTQLEEREALLDSLKQSHEDMHRSAHGNEDTLSILEKRVAELVEWNEFVRDEIAAKADKIQELEFLKGLPNSQEPVDANALLKQNLDLQNEVERMSTLFAEKEAEVQQLKADNEAEMEALRDRLGAAEAATESKTKQLTTSDERYRALLTLKDNAEDKLEFEQTTNQDLQQQLVQLQESVSFKADCYKNVKRSLCEKEAEVEKLEAEIASLKKNANPPEDSTKLTTLQAQLDGLTADNATQFNLIKEQADELARTRALIHEHELSIETLSNEREEQEVKLLTSENNILAADLAKHKQINRKYVRLTKALEKQAAQVAAAAAKEHEDANKRVDAAFERREAECEAFEQKLQAKNEEVRKLQGKLQQVEKAAVKSDLEREDKISSLEADLQRAALNLEAEVAKRTAELEWEAEQREARHKEELDALKNQMKALM